MKKLILLFIGCVIVQSLCITSSYGMNALLAAAIQGNNAFDNQFPLHAAAVKGEAELVEALLLSGGVDVNQRDNRGFSPLNWAALHGYQAVVEALIAANADIHQTADGWTPLHWAAAGGHQAVVQILIDAGANVNERDLVVGQTPLHLAVVHGYYAVAKILIAAGANAYKQNNSGETPLLYAELMRHRYPEIIHFINRVNATPDVAIKQSLALLGAAHHRLGNASSVQVVMQDGQRELPKIIVQYICQAVLEDALYNP